MNDTRQMDRTNEGVVLGLHAFTHDSAACLVINGSLIAFAEEERFSRKKNDAGFPRQAIDYCLQEAGLGPEAISRVVIPFRPRKGSLLRLGYRLRHPRHSIQVVRDLIGKGLKLSHMSSPLAEMGIRSEISYEDHYHCHALSVFLSSPYEEATVVVIDGVAEAWTGACYHARRFPRTSLTCLTKIRFPQSLGLLYAAITEHLGLRHNRDEGSVMAMAAYGDERFGPDFDEICRSDAQNIMLQQRYFDFGGLWTTSAFEKRFFPRKNGAVSFDERDFALARALQKKIEAVSLGLTRWALKQTGCDKLCFSGGLALNPVLNSCLKHQSGCRDFFVIPAGGDAGTALGAALFPFETSSWHLEHAFWGPAFSKRRIEAALHHHSHRVIASGPESIKKAAEMLDRGKIVGRFAGRSEMGPRALGHRSIFADPRSLETRRRINDEIKGRASFRPFAPVLIRDRTPGLSECFADSPFMLLTFPVPEDLGRVIPGVVHVDGSTRVQTVTRDDQSGLYPLLIEFEKLSGWPILLNTSLNTHDEPLANSPEDAVRIFRQTGMDYLLIEDVLIAKER